MYHWEIWMRKLFLLECYFHQMKAAMHAVTIHGKYTIYDANEVIALPLCQDALDYYCTSQH